MIYLKVSRDEMRRLLGLPELETEPAPSPEPGTGNPPPATPETSTPPAPPELTTPMPADVRPPEPIAAPPSPGAQPGTGTPPAAGEPAPSAPAEDRGRARQRTSHDYLTSTHFVLTRPLQRLWRYAQSKVDPKDTRTLHRKLRELIQWHLDKEGYAVHSNVPTLYREGGQTHEGRLELLVEKTPGEPLLAVETDWGVDSASLLKLEVWHRRGVPVLLIAGRPCKRARLWSFRQRANRLLHQPTGRWLPIYHLEHGWIRASAAAEAR